MLTPLNRNPSADENDIMIRFFLFVVVTVTLLALVWLEAAQWISEAINPPDTRAASRSANSNPRRALGDYERIRDNELRAARMRLFHEAATFLERIGHLHGDLTESRAKQADWLQGHLSLPDGLPRFTEPDEVDLFSYWQRLHESKQRFAQSLERFAIEKREIQNAFFKAVEGIDVGKQPLTATESDLQLAAKQEATVQAALSSYANWNRLNFDNFASFQAVYR